MKVRFKAGWRRTYAELTPGNVYRVLGIEAGSLRIIADTGDPVLYEPSAFTLVDSVEPGDWITEWEDGEKYAYPPALRPPVFSFEDWHDGITAARAKLAHHLHMLCWHDAEVPDESANTYLRVRWKHALVDAPVEMLSELDEERWEVRKVDVYADGHMTYAWGKGASGDTGLRECAVPPIEEIAADPQAEPAEISRDEFEAVWDRAFASDDRGP
jgi:hypothetical protein